MDGDRFEIELTPVEEHRTWRHRRHAPPPPATPPVDSPFEEPDGADVDRPADDTIVVSGPPPGSEPPGGWLRSERARLATTAVVAASVALLLGWMLGRAGGGDPALDEAATSGSIVDGSTPVTPESTALAGEPIPPVRTTGPRRTTTIPGIEIGSLAVDERIAGAPIELVTWSNRRVVEVDLTTGTVRTVPAPGVGGVEPEFMRVGAEWTLLMSGMSDSMWIVHSDGTIEVADLGEPWSTQWVPGTDRFWRADDQAWPLSMRLTEVTLDGSPTGVELELSPGSGWGGEWSVDPAGGVLWVAAGGVYAVDVDGAELVGRGDLVAAGATTTLLRTCDEVLVCGYVLVDRVSGVGRELVPVDDRDEPVELESAMYFWGPSSQRQMSPDGRWAVVVTIEPASSSSGLLDLESGRVTTLGEDMWPQQVHFSSDSRYAFHHLAGQPWAIDLESGEHFPVFTERVHWQAFGVRDVRSASASGGAPPSSPPSGGTRGPVSG